jgi:hypothetical protein
MEKKDSEEAVVPRRPFICIGIAAQRVEAMAAV